LPAYLQSGWIDPEKPIFVSKKATAESTDRLGSYLKEIDELKQLSAIYNSVQPSEFDFVDVLKNIYESNQYRIISDSQIN